MTDRSHHKQITAITVQQLLADDLQQAGWAYIGYCSAAHSHRQRFNITLNSLLPAILKNANVGFV